MSFPAVLIIWFRKEPADANFKQAILGLSIEQ